MTRNPSERTAVLGALDGLKFGFGDFGMVRHARRQAGRRRLVPARQTGLARELADVGFGEPRVIERADDAELARRPAARAVVAAIVGVVAVGHGLEPAGARQSRQVGVQLVLAVVAAVGVVGAVLRAASSSAVWMNSWRNPNCVAI